MVKVVFWFEYATWISNLQSYLPTFYGFLVTFDHYFATLFFFQVCMGIVCFLFLPRESVSSETSQSCKKLSILKVLRIPTIWFSFMGFIVATVCNGFLSINLEPQVRFRFILSEIVQIGRNLSKLVETCPNRSKLVQNYQNLSKSVKNCPKNLTISFFLNNSVCN